MKQVLIDRYGAPEEVARCAEVPDVGAPAVGEVVFDVLLFPINPADVSFCRGTYRLRPTLPATPGAECVGRVAAVGAGVTHVKPGDLVINLQRENWTQRRRVKADEALDWGLVDQVVSLAELIPAAQALAAEIAENAPLAVVATRKTLRGKLAAAVRAQTDHEHAQQTILRATEDFAEGVRAVQERRPGNFKGR